MSVDPLAQQYAYYTPYQFAGNMPIMSDDIDGAESRIRIINRDMEGRVIVTIIDGNTLTKSRTVGNGDTYNSDISKQEWYDLKQAIWAGYSGINNKDRFVIGYTDYVSNKGGIDYGFQPMNDKGTLTLVTGEEIILWWFLFVFSDTKRTVMSNC